jgi:hypothetical protein
MSMASNQQINGYAAQSAFVFTGTVLTLNAATVGGIPTDNTAVVQVDRVVTAPAMFTSLAGSQITVRFKKLSDVRKGSAMTFFTNGWIFSSSIAVDAVGYVDVTGTLEVATMMRAANTSNNDAMLSARLESAAMVVAGTVTKVARSAERPTFISEHDPLWHDATIHVDEVIKGTKDTTQVTVLFPKSDDIRWHEVRKFAEGQHGIWLLQKGRNQGTTGIPSKVFAAIPTGSDLMTAMHAMDFLPLDELGRVKALLRT